MYLRVGLAVGALLLAACSGGDDDAPGGGGGGIADRLKYLPAAPGDDAVVVGFGDLAQAADLADVSLADAKAGDEAYRALSAIAGGMVEGKPSTVAALLPEAAHLAEARTQLDEFADELGWNILQVDSFVEYQVPPDDVTVMAGDFDEDRLSEVLGKPKDGIWVVGDPDGFDLEDTSPARPLGEPLWLSLVDGQLVVTRTEQAMGALRSGDGETMADDATLRALAEALDGEDVYSALLTEEVDADPRVAPGECGGFLPEPFAGVAAAIAADGGPVVVLAYAHADADAAKANAAALKDLVTRGTSATSGQPWSEYLTVDSVEADGNVVVARLPLKESVRAELWRQVLQQRDNLVAHCA